MIKVPNYNKNDRKQTFERLPKGTYVCKIMEVAETEFKSGKKGVKIRFDIAEGEYKDFYLKQYQASTSEDKKWSNSAITYLTIPYDGCPEYVTTRWASFWADVEDSNNGYVFTGDEQSVKGKIFGGSFRNEQNEYNGSIYDKTVLAFTDIAQKVRDGKTREANDKLVEGADKVPDFISVNAADTTDLPFK